MTSPTSIAPSTGRLGVLCVGLGAVTTTFLAGVELARKGMGSPVGSLTQMGTIRLGKRTEGRSPLIKDFVPLADLAEDHPVRAGPRDGGLDGGQQPVRHAPERRRHDDAAAALGAGPGRELDDAADALGRPDGRAAELGDVDGQIGHGRRRRGPRS